MAKQTFTTGQVLTAAQMTSLQQTAMLGGSASAKTSNYTLAAADAGTAITMSNAGATTITVNTGLFAAGDTVTILNVGAGTCTITAGTATVSKPTNATLALVQNAGGVLYFTATGAATFMPFDVGSAGASPLTTKGDLFTFDTANARLPVGSNGQTLVADSAAGTGLKWGNPSWVGCQVSLSAAQSMANATNTAISWTAENLDTNGFHSTASNQSRFTIPSGYAGKYMIQGVLQYNTNTTGIRGAYIYKNGAVMSFNAQFSASSALTTLVNFIYVADLAVGDYLEVFGYQSSGGNLDVNGAATSNSNCSLTYLGA